MNIVIIKDDNTWGCSNHSHEKSSVRKIKVDDSFALKKEMKLVVEKPYIEGDIKEGDVLSACTMDGGEKNAYEVNVLSLHKGDLVLLVLNKVNDIDNLIRKIK